MNDEQQLEYLQTLYFKGKKYYEKDKERERAKRFYFENVMREGTVNGEPCIDLSHLLKKQA